jgi:hypothetical protein
MQACCSFYMNLAMNGKHEAAKLRYDTRCNRMVPAELMVAGAIRWHGADVRAVISACMRCPHEHHDGWSSSEWSSSDFVTHLFSAWFCISLGCAG